MQCYVAPANNNFSYWISAFNCIAHRCSAHVEHLLCDHSVHVHCKNRKTNYAYMLATFGDMFEI